MLGDLDPDSPDALFVQLANRLRAAIDDGTYTTRLPSEAALGQEFGVSRDTVRRAIFLLVQEGAVTVSPGRGTFVTPAGGHPRQL